jgi:hypothetical protein
MKTNTFIYIDDFNFHDEESKDRFYGHPIVGKVYKALKVERGEDVIFKIPLESIDGAVGIILEGVERDGPGKWSHKLFEVTDRNIIDLNISLDDLKLIEKEWIDYDIPESKKIEVEKANNTLDIEGIFMKVSDCLNTIVDNDEDMFLTISEIIEDISLSYRSTTDPELKLAIINKINELKERRK